MRHILTIILLLGFLSAFSQATDFTTDDCNGITHNLFDSLDAGNVIVIAWVMPCGPCVTYSLPAYSAVQSFNTSHPNQVDFYLVDDYANTTCPSLINWGIANNMSLNTTFSSADISMTDYGTPGMPKVVVLGGQNHHIYFNENENKINFLDVQTAINNALNDLTSFTSDLSYGFALDVFPNPVKDIVQVSYFLDRNEEVVFEIIDLSGKIMKTINTFNHIGNHTIDFHISELEPSHYIFKMSTSERVESLMFLKTN